MSDPPRRPAFVWLLLLTCVVYAGLFVFTAAVTVRYDGLVKNPGWTVHPTAVGWFVSDVDEGGPADGRIARGDRLLAIDGDQRSGVLGPSLFINVHSGDTYRVDLDRGGRRVSLDLLLPVAFGRYLWPLFQVVGLVFFACGAALGLLRPRDAQVRFVSLLLMSVGFLTLVEALGPPRRFLVGWERAAHLAVVALSLFTPPMTFHFFSRFPTWNRPGPLSRGVQWILYGLFVFVFWPSWLVNFAGLHVSDSLTGLLVAHPTVYLTGVRLADRAIYVYIAACLILAMIAVARTGTGRCPIRQLAPNPLGRGVAGRRVCAVHRGGLRVPHGRLDQRVHLSHLVSGHVPDDARDPGVHRDRGLEGAVVRRPRPRPPRTAGPVCARGAPHASCAADSVAGVVDLLESEPHGRADSHGALRLGERRVGWRHRDGAPVAAAAPDFARQAVFSRSVSNRNGSSYS